MERESMEFDLVIVGGGPAGLATAIKFAQLTLEAGEEYSVCLVEKGSEIGAHILSGAVVEPRALNELFPDWQAMGAPLNNPVTEDDVYYLVDDHQGLRVPGLLVPKALHNRGNYATSLGNLCRRTKVLNNYFSLHDAYRKACFAFLSSMLGQRISSI